MSEDLKTKKVVKDAVREGEASQQYNFLMQQINEQNQTRLSGLLQLGEILYWGMEAQRARGCFEGFSTEEMQGVWSTYLIQAARK